MRRLVDASCVRTPVPVRSRPRWSRRIPTRIAHGIGHDNTWVFMNPIGNKAVNPKLAESAPNATDHRIGANSGVVGSGIALGAPTQGAVGALCTSIVHICEAEGSRPRSARDGDVEAHDHSAETGSRLITQAAIPRNNSAAISDPDKR